MLKGHFLLLLLLLFTTNCSYIFQVMKTPEQREAELEQLAGTVAKIYSWQSFEELLPMASSGMQLDNIRQLAKQYRNRKVNEVLIDQVSFKDESTRAFSVLEIKTFAPPNLTIQSHYDQFEWIFDRTKDGWKIIQIDCGMATPNESRSNGGER